jgi:hypothetical protein
MAPSSLIPGRACRANEPAGTAQKGERRWSLQALHGKPDAVDLCEARLYMWTYAP